MRGSVTEGVKDKVLNIQMESISIVKWIQETFVYLNFIPILWKIRLFVFISMFFDRNNIELTRKFIKINGVYIQKTVVYNKSAQ